MFTTLVAVLCHAIAAGVPACVEEIVTDTSMSGITFQACLIDGQIGISKWMTAHPVYRTWRLESWKCAPGRYEIPGKA